MPWRPADRFHMYDPAFPIEPPLQTAEMSLTLDTRSRVDDGERWNHGPRRAGYRGVETAERHCSLDVDVLCTL